MASAATSRSCTATSTPTATDGRLSFLPLNRERPTSCRTLSIDRLSIRQEAERAGRLLTTEAGCSSSCVLMKDLRKSGVRAEGQELPIRQFFDVLYGQPSWGIFKPFPGSVFELWPDTLTSTLQAFHFRPPKSFLMASWFLYAERLSKLTWSFVGSSTNPTNSLLSFNADFSNEKQLFDLQTSGYFTYLMLPSLTSGLPQLECPMWYECEILLLKLLTPLLIDSLCFLQPELIFFFEFDGKANPVNVICTGTLGAPQYLFFTIWDSFLMDSSW